MIGHDADHNEYWPYFHKEQFSMLFIKNKASGEWYYYDKEDDLVKVEQSLSKKGLKEKKLKENLKRLMIKMKFKKSKEADDPMSAESEDVEMKGEEDKNEDEEDW